LPTRAREKEKRRFEQRGKLKLVEIGMKKVVAKKARCICIEGREALR
jgi:hypothetical protein